MQLFRSRYLQVTHTLSLVAILFGLWALISKSSQLPSEVPLWYIQPTIERLAPVTFLWYIPAVTALLWLVNIGISVVIFRRAPLVPSILATSSVAITFMGTITIIRIISIYTTLL